MKSKKNSLNEFSLWQNCFVNKNVPFAALGLIYNSNKTKD